MAIDIKKPELYNNYITKNMTMLEVGDYYGVSKGVVYKLLKKYDIRKLTKRHQDIYAFSTYTPESCYWAGFIAADGNIQNDFGKLTIALQKSDTPHLKKFLEFMKSNAAINTVVGDFGTLCSETKIYCKPLCLEIYKNFNITPNKSLTLVPPPLGTNKYISHYIRGYMDGDGSIYKGRYFEVGFCSGSKLFLEWIKQVIKDNVVQAGNPSIIVKNSKKGKAFYFKFGGIQSNYILDWIYKSSDNSILLDRKYKKYLEG